MNKLALPLFFLLTFLVPTAVLADDQPRKRYMPSFLIIITTIPRMGYEVVSVAYFPTYKICLEALKIVQKQSGHKIGAINASCQTLQRE